MLKSILSTIVLGTALVGCQSANSNPTSKAAAAASTQAVACSKCQVTWVKTPQTYVKGNPVAYTKEKKMTCPDCKDAVENFFTTGHLSHDCKSCGPDTMQVCAH
jgi:hypothetical protein